MVSVTDPVDLSVIIVNYRGWKSLSECLASISEWRDLTYSFEVIIVDNCSNDGQLETFRKLFPRFHFLLNSGNHGFAHGCNTGAAAAKGAYLLFLNPDTVAKAAAMNALMHCARHSPDKTLLSCAQHDSKGKDMRPYGWFLSPVTLFGVSRAIHRKRIGPLSDHMVAGHHAWSPDWVSGSVILMSCGFFKLIGGWEESYWMYFEDMDLCLRVRSAGGQVFFLTDVSLRHDHGGSSRVNVATRALTKSEVMISRHVYIQRNIGGWVGKGMHAALVFTNVFTFPLLLAILGMVFFFLPQLYVRFKLYTHLLRYYFSAIKSGSWISRRSVRSVSYAV